MYRSTHDGTVLTMRCVARGIRGYGTLRSVRKILTGALAREFPWLSARSVADIAREADLLARTALLLPNRGEALTSLLSMGCDGVMKAWNRAYRTLWNATRKKMAYEGMEARRKGPRKTVFYLVSTHPHPAKGHASIQGAVLVDPDWKEEYGPDSEVAMVIRRKRIRTVSWAMGGPTWLLTRPNCRHRLIPLDTSAVLGWRIPTVYDRTRRKSDAERWREYKTLRRDIAKAVARPGKAG